MDHSNALSMGQRNQIILEGLNLFHGEMRSAGLDCSEIPFQEAIVCVRIATNGRRGFFDGANLRSINGQVISEAHVPRRRSEDSPWNEVTWG